MCSSLESAKKNPAVFAADRSVPSTDPSVHDAAALAASPASGSAPLRDVADMDVAAMAEEITTLSGHIAAATCRLLMLLAAFDTAGGWHGAGIRSCAHWLTWRCALSSSTAHEHLRVAHALTDLPILRAAFGRGELSYSKVRALTRVATAAGEAELVSVATHATASQLDRLCQGLARAGSNEEVLGQAASSRFSATWQPDGMLRISGRLAPEDGQVLLAALAELRGPAVTDPIDDKAPDIGPTEADLAAGNPHRDESPAGDPDRGESMVGDLPGDQYRDAAALAARSAAAALVALAGHALANPPAEAGGGTPVRLIVHTTDNVMAALGASETRTDQASAEPLSAAAPSAEGRDGPSDATPTVGILDAGPGIPLLPLGPDTLRRLACEALVEPNSHPDDPEPLRVQHRFATARQRRALLRRDGGCAFPACSRRRHLHAHHQVEWSAGGPTTMSNLMLTCGHHHRLIHEGGWQLRRETDANGHISWVAVAPDGQRRAAASPTCGDVRDLPDAHTATIAPDTVTGHWRGEPLDLDYAVSVFGQRARLSAAANA